MSHDPYEKKPRKPVAFTLMSNFVVASDRPLDNDEDEPRSDVHENWEPL